MKLYVRARFFEKNFFPGKWEKLNSKKFLGGHGQKYLFMIKVINETIDSNVQSQLLSFLCLISKLPGKQIHAGKFT